MANGDERRRYTRLSTAGGPYEVVFQINDRQVTSARLANLSAGGCGLEVQMVDAWDLDMGTVLDNICVIHADLPCVPLQGTVVRLLGKVPGKTSGYVLAGVEFTMITPFVQEMIACHVEVRCPL
jgi:c-di-GMP-binding flagellar brake protein YcgR